jgi:hypothetical protein
MFVSVIMNKGRSLQYAFQIIVELVKHPEIRIEAPSLVTIAALNEAILYKVGLLLVVEIIFRLGYRGYNWCMIRR